ncbi:MAG: rhamnan synthesis F family protein [Desulforegulaceae bacterium]|nr:rhamnan synthesis F family protein [Desulforegulaceae bacterium]
MSRALIFVHYNKYNSLSQYVVYTLEKMHNLFEFVIFVSNSRLDKQDEKKIKKYSHKVIQRENLGYDFGAWKDTFKTEGWDFFSQFDSVTLMNDTCFGPLFEMANIFETMENNKIDFWGITNHKNTKNGMPITNQEIPEHLQSYFLSFSKETVSSQIFKNFWENIEFFQDVRNVISCYETKLTKLLVDSGFKYQAWINTIDLKNENPDFANWHPDLLIKLKNPFVKIKGFLNFKNPYYLKQLISKHSEYPINLIDEHFNSILSPDSSINISNKTIIVSKHNLPHKNFTTTAIHIHVYYPDILSDYIAHLEKSKSEFDIYITTDTLEKKQIIISLFNKSNIKNRVKNIFVFDNKGRDVLPWLKISSILNQYNLAGHFHTKKTDWKESWIGESWQNEILEALIRPMDYIISFLNNNQQIGIIVPDKPFYYSNILLESDTWGDNRELFKSLWNKMNCLKQIDPFTIKSPLMPYGNMFWYRPNALKKLFDLNLNEDNFLEEPLPVDGTIAHALERMPVYISWSENYDFRIAVPAKMILNSFCGKTFYTVKESTNEFSTVVNSLDYRIGKLILYVPRKIYRFLKKLINKL